MPDPVIPPATNLPSGLSPVREPVTPSLGGSTASSMPPLVTAAEPIVSPVDVSALSGLASSLNETPSTPVIPHAETISPPQVIPPEPEQKKRSNGKTSALIGGLFLLVILPIAVYYAVQILNPAEMPFQGEAGVYVLPPPPPPAAPSDKEIPGGSIIVDNEKGTQPGENFAKLIAKTLGATLTGNQQTGWIYTKDGVTLNPTTITTGRSPAGAVGVPPLGMNWVYATPELARAALTDAAQKGNVSGAVQMDAANGNITTYSFPVKSGGGGGGGGGNDTYTPPTNPYVPPSPGTPTPTPAPNGCAYTPCENDTECYSGLSCVTATNSLKYCSVTSFQDACKASPSLGTCCYPSPTPIITSTPTPIITSTPTPIITSTPTPIITSTPTPIITSTPTPIITSTPTPTQQSSELSVCDASCDNDSGCRSGMICATIEGIKRCRNPECISEYSCNCPVVVVTATPKPIVQQVVVTATPAPVPQTPVAGIPSILGASTIVGGIFLLFLGFLL